MRTLIVIGALCSAVLLCSLQSCNAGPREKVAVACAVASLLNSNTPELPDDPGGGNNGTAYQSTANARVQLDLLAKIAEFETKLAEIDQRLTRLKESHVLHAETFERKLDELDKRCVCGTQQDRAVKVDSPPDGVSIVPKAATSQPVATHTGSWSGNYIWSDGYQRSYPEPGKSYPTVGVYAINPTATYSTPSWWTCSGRSCRKN